ncbi:uncharacterized protein L969DRAFT_92917 [Mixia osmundae IAM 14324]|uniref:Uncharacterized protein n=1 Tax=Mixia osmundae (strain CBS 9802 / IAM 14324 / JCM 22182 / KY 12970) TaxID=764103 RepID=G7DTR7_MIXOS|nr:uncharacterized protein L969DRAFT_92917 [Mixia osmundae IAM 14324]KEI41693.1 hypothetical protein L969DRAFT_92917 [Mixia osmundae IAM 14324]GAA93977.1 hypothetical protein E5Q_00624 [Mixia osmundae IAM 14324]
MASQFCAVSDFNRLLRQKVNELKQMYASKASSLNLIRLNESFSAYDAEIANTAHDAYVKAQKTTDAILYTSVKPGDKTIGGGGAYRVVRPDRSYEHCQVIATIPSSDTTSLLIAELMLVDIALAIMLGGELDQPKGTFHFFSKSKTIISILSQIAEEVNKPGCLVFSPQWNPDSAEADLK